MTIQDLVDQFEIQGAFCIKKWNWDVEDYAVFADGHDFECDRCNIRNCVMDSKIAYMYAVDGILNIEVE